MITKMTEKMEYKSARLESLLGRSLNDIEKKYAPEKIYYKGATEIPLSCARISVIGTRQPTKEGLLAVEEVSEVLIKNQIMIVSGLAKGIDTAAHKAAIKNAGKTIAVVGTPLDKIYPKENIELEKKIMEKNLIISQYPIGHKTTPKDFVLRDRTMALISDASVIVEAGESSGSLYQGWETLRLGKRLFICKSVISNPKLKWPKKMAEYGAIELDDPEHILESVPSNIKMPELFQEG